MNDMQFRAVRKRADKSEGERRVIQNQLLEMQKASG